MAGYLSDKRLPNMSWEKIFCFENHAGFHLEKKIYIIYVCQVEFVIRLIFHIVAKERKKTKI